MNPRELAITLRTIAGSAFTGPLNQAKAEIKSFGTEVGETFDSIEERGEKLKGLWKDLFEAFIGVEMIDGLKKIAEAADTAAGALEIAANTAKNFGKSFDVSEMDAWLKRLAASAEGGGFALQDMRTAIQQTATTGASETQQQRALVDILGLAAAKHISVAEATHLWTEAATGHVEILGRYGIATKDATGKTIDFSTAMSHWESMVAGAAQKRAEGLEGAFGRVGNALNRLVTGAFGQALVGEFTAAANAIAHVLDAVGKLPPAFLAFAASAAFGLLSLTALGLMLPAVKIGFEFLSNGLFLARGAAVLAWKGIGLVGELLGAIIPVVRGAAAAMFGLSAAEAAAAGGPLAIIGASLALLVVLMALAEGVEQLGTHWSTVSKSMSTAWGEFVNNVLGSRKVLVSFLQDIAGALAHDPAALARLAVDTQVYMPKTTASVAGSTTAIESRVTSAVKSAVKWVSDFFGAQLGKIKPPPVDWSGLGGPGKGNQKAIDDWLTAILAAIDAMLARVQQHVAEAQARLEKTQAELAALRDKRDPKQPLTMGGPTGVAAEQVLEREELARTIAARATLVEQRNAELRAAQILVATERNLPAGDKERVKHLAEITKQMNAHLLSAIKIDGAWAKMGGTIAKIVRTIRDATDAIHNQQIELLGTTRKSAYDTNRSATEARTAHLQAQHEVADIVHPAVSWMQPVEEAHFDLTPAQNAVTVARAGLAEAQATESDAKSKRYDDPVAREAAIAAATLQRVQAENSLEAALDANAVATAKYKKALQDTQFTLANVIDGLTKKLGVPGLEMQKNKQGGYAGFALNPTTFLTEAISQTKAFADVQKVATEIMKVFGEVLDSLRPIIDLVLKAVAFVANIFIDLYNVVAQLLRLFGVHIALLDRINTDFSDLDQNTAPLISIIHDVPTLNELASGNVGTLSPTPSNYSDLSQVQAPTIDAIKSPDLGGGLLSVLGDILEGILAIKAVTALFGSGGFLSSLIGGGSSGGGGLIGLVKGLFGAGGSSGWASDAGQFDAASMGGGSWDDAASASSSSGDGGVLGFLKTSGIGAALEGAGIGDLGVTLGKAIGGGVQGAVVGALGAVAGLSVALGGGLSLSGIGAALGATGVGLPIGAIVAGIGALFGSGIIGGPKINAHDNPDLAGDVSSYGQGMANLGGNGGEDWGQAYVANGQAFTENSQLSQQLGGHGEIDYLADYIKGGGTGLDPSLASEFSGANGVTYLANGMVSIGNGVTKYWSDLVADASKAIGEIGSTITSTFGAAASTLAGQAQSITQGVNAMGNDLVSSMNSARAATGAIATAISTITTGGDTFHNYDIDNTFTGDINSASDMDDLGAQATRAFRNSRYVIAR